MEALRKAEEAKRKVQNQNPESLSNLKRDLANQDDIAPSPVLSATVGTELTLQQQDSDVTADYIVDKFLSNESDAKNASLTQVPPLRQTARKPGRASVEELQSYLETTPELEDTTHPTRDVPGKVSSAAQQRAAGSVFAAKQKPAQSNATRNTLLVLLVLLVPIVGGGLWYIGNSGSSSMLVDPSLLTSDFANRSFSDEQFSNEPTPQPQQQNPVAGLPASDQTQPTIGSPSDTAQQVALAPQNVTTESDIVPEAEPAESSLAPQTSLSESVESVATQPLIQTANEFITAAAGQSQTTDTSTGSTATVLEVSHSKKATTNNPQLVDAYASFQTGDFAAASALYEQVLQQFPNNRDALLGSAAVAIRNENFSRARELYARLMQLNPKDPLARTGLLQTVQDIDPVQHEIELKKLLQQFPDVAPLSFALGNVYATQQKWNEAQSAYFDAFLFARQSNESAINPDYAYNLAVSLEQINQPKAALDYYLQAQTLARVITPGFDPQALSSRISFLEQQKP